MSHRHEFHALWWHFGKYGRQDVHLHPCDCGTELVGMGRACGGTSPPHHVVSLTSRSRWGDRSNEGKPLPGRPLRVAEPEMAEVHTAQDGTRRQ